VTGDAVTGRRAAGRRAARGALLTGAALLALLAACSTGPASPGASSPGRAATGTASGPATGTVRAGGAGGSPVPSVVPTSPGGHQVFEPVHTDVGRLIVTRLHGARSGVTLRVWVWLPPQYDQPAYARTAFPALMLYPGGTGAGYNTWAGTQYHAREEDAAGAATGRLTPFVFVMPEMQPSARLDTECADLPGQARMATFLGTDVRRMVEDNLRVLADRVGWGAAGASAGAYCAARTVFDHPDQYAAVVSIAGYFTIETALPGHADPSILAQDPAAVARRSPPPVSVLLWAGGDNGTDLKDARAFLALVRAPTSAELRVLPGGRHLTTDFARMMPGSLAFLSAHLARPTPIP